MSGKTTGWALAALAAMAPAVSGAADKLTLGMMTTLSGPAAIIGTDLRDGARLALDHLHNQVGGLPTTLLVEDDQQKAEVAIDLANRLVRQSKVDLLVGFSFSNLMLAVAGQLKDTDTIMISANPGPSQLAGKDCSKYFLSTSWQGDNWAEAMGAYMQKKGIQNVYLMAPNYAAAPVLRRMASAERLGRKTGVGFYEYKR